VAWSACVPRKRHSIGRESARLFRTWHPGHTRGSRRRASGRARSRKEFSWRRGWSSHRHRGETGAEPIFDCGNRALLNTVPHSGAGGADIVGSSVRGTSVRRLLGPQVSLLPLAANGCQSPPGRTLAGMSEHALPGREGSVVRTQESGFAPVPLPDFVRAPDRRVGCRALP